MYKKLEFETQMDNIKGLDKGASLRAAFTFRTSTPNVSAIHDALHVPQDRHSPDR
jgi:N12 class adenine-specific DNA methylase